VWTHVAEDGVVFQLGVEVGDVHAATPLLAHGSDVQNAVCGATGDLQTPQRVDEHVFVDVSAHGHVGVGLLLVLFIRVLVELAPLELVFLVEALQILQQLVNIVFTVFEFLRVNDLVVSVPVEGGSGDRVGQGQPHHGDHGGHGVGREHS